MATEKDSIFSIPDSLLKKNQVFLQIIDQEISNTQGPLLRLLKVVAKLMRSLGKEASTNNLIELCELQDEIPGAFASVNKALEAGKIPLDSVEIIKKAREHSLEIISWIQETLSEKGISPTIQGSPATEIRNAISDSFASSTARARSRRSHTMLGSPDSPSDSLEKREVPDDLKNWVNPGRGKIR